MSTYPIVGAYHYPPAQALLDALPLGASLTLLAEPDNPYDPNAVTVFLYVKNLPDSSKEKLRETLPPFGFDLDQIMSGSTWHLGYIPRDLAKALRDSGTVPLNDPVEGTFSLSPNGKPRIRLEN